MESYDVVVVGSGPSGATAARRLAETGISVLLLDKKQELGAPIQCSGAVSASALRESNISPDDEFIVTNIYGFTIYSTQGDKVTIDYRKIFPDKYNDTALGYIVDRRRFDRHLMTLAERAGAVTKLKAEALGIERLSADFVELHYEELGQQKTVKTKIIIGADGVQSRVGKWVGCKTYIKLSELASCLQYITDHIPTNGLLEIITGHQWAPGGYAWVFPKQNELSEIGLGIIRSITDKDAYWHLDNFIHHSFMKERFKNLKILEIQGGGVPLAAPLTRQYSDNVILIGDAARHVNPITGGGIHTAIKSGILAADFLAAVIQQKLIPTANVLQGYQTIWLEQIGNVMLKLYAHKKAIFRMPIQARDAELFKTFANYFQPNSEYKKI